MTWPSSDVVTTNADAGTDSPATFRTDVLDLLQKFNQIRAHVSTLGQTLLSRATAALMRADLGAAASGANTDITSLSGPALGVATATTATLGDSSTKVATTAFVQANAPVVPAATTVVFGKARFGTLAEHQALALGDVAVTPASLKAVLPVTGRANTNYTVGTDRVYGTTYYNPCAYPITVTFTSTNSGGSAGGVVVDGVTIASYNFGSIVAGCFLSFQVAPGLGYSITLNTGSHTSPRWAENR